MFQARLVFVTKAFKAPWVEHPRVIVESFIVVRLYCRRNHYCPFRNVCAIREDDRFHSFAIKRT